ncbi:hypothetical protein CNMCM6936_001685 [Aspergillus lentulus]|nr:hypothetical protein CNMCM6936_001685 [Aspergillus lentulus]KAF4178307.1 hypothetical protein CNMCM8060_004610 [Aspergillus lentulus]KAF4198526.1 hypothetical protein CNMCM8694_009239 [Aspergillus lentulus]
MMQSSHFWTSKIKSEECGFAFEVHELEPSKARIWDLGQCLKGILDLSEPDTTTMVNNPMDPVGMDWVKLPWPIKAPNTGDPQKYIEGCQILYTQRVIFSSHLRQITVSCIDIEDTGYITGLKLSFDNGTSTQLGYRSRNNPSADIVAFGGFIVAVGTAGIHGLQIIDEDSDATQWFGSNERCPQTRMLKSEEKIVGMTASFDGFKLVSLALGRPNQRKRKSWRSLLNTALWYPCLPPDKLRMKDGFSVGQSPTKSRHNLLFWVWFGGPGGSYLQYLTGISVTRSQGGFGGIEFHFSTDSVPITSRKLGLCDDKQGPDFAIDGAGGEYITSVYGRLPQMPYLPALVIYTNRGRKFAALRQSFDVAKMKRLFPGESNSILTGFYTSYRDHDSPMRSLGCLWERS